MGRLQQKVGEETWLFMLKYIASADAFFVGWISQWNLFNSFMGETNYLIYLFEFTICLRMCCIIQLGCVRDNVFALFSSASIYNFYVVLVALRS